MHFWHKVAAPVREGRRDRDPVTGRMGRLAPASWPNEATTDFRRGIGQQKCPGRTAPRPEVHGTRVRTLSRDQRTESVTRSQRDYDQVARGE